MIREDAISPLTIPPGDVYPLFQLLLPTKRTRTRVEPWGFPTGFDKTRMENPTVAGWPWKAYGIRQ